MGSKILVDGTIATKSWREVVGRVLSFLVLFPIVLLFIPAGILWLVSLGHINFAGPLGEYFDKFGNEVFEWEE